jgi:hypothetical protein
MSTARHDIPPEMLREVGLEPDANGSLSPLTPLTPLLREIPGAVPFPVDALPGSCRRLVTEAAAALECPPDLVALPMLATLGSAIGDARWVQLKESWKERANIYAAVIANPGAKKTPAAGVATEPAERKQIEMRNEYRKKYREYERSMLEYDKDKRECRKSGTADPLPPSPPVMERTYVDDTTVEALVPVLRDNPRGVVVIKDELTGWIKAMDQYKAGGKGADRQFYLSGWSRKSYVNDRKGEAEAVILPHPFMSVVGSIQPDVLHELSDGREDGMLDRFLFADPAPVASRWTDEEISTQAREGYARLYEGIRSLSLGLDDHGDPMPAMVHFSPDAKAALRDEINGIRSEMEIPGFPERLQWVWSKIEAYVARLSLIIALCRVVEKRAPERIEAEDVLRASALVAYFKSHARRVYARLYGEDRDARLIEDVAQFLYKHGGTWAGSPSALHEELRSQHKPPTPEALTRKLNTLSKRYRAIGFESGKRWNPETENSERHVKISLRDSVNGVNGDKVEE